MGQKFVCFCWPIHRFDLASTLCILYVSSIDLILLSTLVSSANMNTDVIMFDHAAMEVDNSTKFDRMLGVFGSIVLSLKASRGRSFMKMENRRGESTPPVELHLLLLPPLRAGGLPSPPGTCQ